jgi:uncharacterized protein (AIM24 family)
MDTIVLDTSDPTGSIIINSGDSYTASTSVNLSLSFSDGAGSGVSTMRILPGAPPWSGWMPVSTTKNIVLPAGDGIKTVYIEYQDAAGNISTAYSDSIILDQSGPSGSISINSGSGYTASTSVSLALYANDGGGSGVSQMQFSNDGSSWTGWQPYTPSTVWDLATGDGTKTVYVRYRDTLGNQSTFNDDIILDTAEPGGSVSIEGGDLYTSDPHVQLNLNASDGGGSGVASMRLSHDGSNWTGWEAFSSTKSWTLLSGDGTKTVYVEFMDQVGWVSSPQSDSILLDTTSPLGEIYINGGAAYTTDSAVTLSLNAHDGIGSGISTMRFSNNGSSWTAWETYQLTKDWLLPSGDGNKSVYVQYKDYAGNYAGFNDTIFLDETDPSGTIIINNGDAYTNNHSVNLMLSMDDGNGSGLNQARFSNDYSVWSAWEPYTASKTWELAAGTGSRIVYVQFTDNAGNIAIEDDAIVVDMQPPNGTITIESDAAYTNDTHVLLTLSASDSGGASVSHMRFSNNGTMWSSWIPYSTSSAWTMDTGDGTKQVYVQYKDSAGNQSSSSSDTIILDTVPPGGSITINDGDAYAGSASVSLSLSAEDGSGSGVSQMRFSNNGASWESWETFSASKIWTMTAGDGAKTVYVEYKDVAGNFTGFSDGIILDTSGPGGSVLIEYGDVYTNNALVALTLNADDSGGSGVWQMRFSNDQISWSGWEGYSASKAWTIPTGDGTKQVYAQYRDYLGYESTPSSDSIILDTVPPSGSVDINSGSAYTSSPEVTLSLTASDGGGSGVTRMRFSNDGAAWSDWQDFNTAKSWSLNAEDGEKYVYVQFEDAAGNRSSSASDSIHLDTSPPSGSVQINNGDAYTGSTSVDLVLSANDGSGIGVSQMRFSNDSATWSEWQSYSTSETWETTSGDGTKTVYVQYRDSLGNYDTYSDTIIMDNDPPTGSLWINNGDAYTNQSNVLLNTQAQDAGAGVSSMRFSNNGTNWSDWESYAASSSWSLTSGDGEKTVYVQYQDAVGKISIVYEDTIIVETSPPEGTILIEEGKPYSGSTNVNLALVADDSGGSGVARMQFSNDGSTWSAWETFSSSKSWSLTPGDGSKTVFVKYKDGAGNVSNLSSDTILLDMNAPDCNLSINNGEAYTNQEAAMLSISANDGDGTGLDQMRFSNDGLLWSEWGTPLTTKDWELTSGEGDKAVYIQCSDLIGHTSESAADSIILDQTPPESSSSSPASSPSMAFTVSWSGSDNSSGISEYDVQFRVGAGGSWVDWLKGTAITSKAFGPAQPVKTVQGEKYYFRVRALDKAGNVEEFSAGANTSTLIEILVRNYLPVMVR